MKNIASYLFPIILIVLGGAILIVGAQQGQNHWVLLGAGLALIAGTVALLMQLGFVGRGAGMIAGIVFSLAAIFLVYRSYRSVAEVLEFTEAKKQNDSKVIQGLKDLRTAQLGYRQATGAYTGDLEVLKSFVKNGSIPMVRSIGQVPDTLTEADALALNLIVRDTIQAPALDSLFMSSKAQTKRVYPFDPERFILSPASGKPFLLTSGSISTSGRNVPVFLVKDPTPMVAGDTLMVGNMEKASTAGNWSGE